MLARGRVPDQVAEHDRHDLADLGGDVREELRAAGGAEPCVFRVVPATARARAHVRSVAGGDGFLRPRADPRLRVGGYPLVPSTIMNVAVIGATGAVGREMARILQERNFPVDRFLPLASARSVGRHVPFRDAEHEVHELTVDALAGVDVAFVSAGATTSAEYLPGSSWPTARSASTTRARSGWTTGYPWSYPR